MSLLRFAALVALALWVGGLATLGGLAAPVLFRELAADDPTGGLAGRVFGVMYTRLQYIAVPLALIVLGSLAVRAAIGPRPRRWGLRMWTVAGMLVVSLAGGLLIAPRIEALRSGVADSIRDLPADDSRRVTFGRLHALSSGLMAATLLTGLGLMWAEMRDPH
jgi:hypothetical protein